MTGPIVTILPLPFVITCLIAVELIGVGFELEIMLGEGRLLAYRIGCLEAGRFRDLGTGIASKTIRFVFNAAFFLVLGGAETGLLLCMA